MLDRQPEEKKPSYIVAAAADRLLGIVTFVLALIMLLYGVYVLYDTAYLNRKAFVSQDLLQYKPDVEATDELLGFSDILDLNPNTVGWLNVFDTNIDYPLMQGILFVTTFIMLIAVIVSDLICILIDPKVRRGDSLA